MLWMYRRVMFGPVESAENERLVDLGLREKLVMVAVVIPIVWIGVHPETFLRRIEPSVVELLRRVEERGSMGAEAPSDAPGEVVEASAVEQAP
jgi:NADH-quinone oxidoreductase subunit M